MTQDYPKFIVSNQKEESISIQRAEEFSNNIVGCDCWFRTFDIKETKNLGCF